MRLYDDIIHDVSRIGRDLNKYVNFVAVVAGFDLPDAKGY